MGGGFSGDNRLGYTHSGMSKYYNWRKIKNEYRVFLKSYPYMSAPSDMLKYEGCVSFDSMGAFNKPPCYSLYFQARDVDIRSEIINRLAALKSKWGFMEGPVTVFLHRNYNVLGSGKKWFRNHDRNYGAHINYFRSIPVDVDVFLPSITRDGKRMPNYAALGHAHRWVSNFAHLPQSAMYNDWMMQCYTYCADEYGRFFPCGCDWKGECEAKPSGENGVLDDSPKRTIFYGAYTVDLHNPRISHLFLEAEHRNYYLNVLPMNVDMFSNCRYGLVSMNEQYAFELKLNQGIIYRKGPPGKKRVCETSGWWIFASTYCYDVPYPGWSFRTACKSAEHKKYGLRGCNDSNGMCAGETSKHEADLRYEHLPMNGWHTYYTLPFSKRGYDITSLTFDKEKMTAASHGNGDREVIWLWNYKHIPEESRITPLALLLTDKGELVLYNGLNKRVGSLTKEELDYDVNREDENYVEGQSGDGTDEDSREYRRMMHALNFEAWRKRQVDGEKALLQNIDDLQASGRKNVCPAPPFEFI